jgi:uncharacterized RDD family membrane protein YckC
MFPLKSTEVGTVQYVKRRRDGRTVSAANAKMTSRIDNAGALVAAAVIAMQLTFLSPLVQGLSAYALFLLYFFVSEAIFSSTVGKWCFGLSVQSIDGTKCTITQAAIRTVLRIFELNPILLGALPAIVLILFSRRKQRLGGMLSKTVVTSSR